MIVTVTLNAAIDKRYRVDQVRPHTVLRVTQCQYTAGGKGLNVARAVAGCRRPVLATGFVGGFAGQYIAAQLDQEGIAHRFVTVPGESRSCINIVDRDGRSTELLEPGVPVAAEALAALAEVLEDVLPRASLVVFSGSAPATCPAQVYLPLVELVRSAGTPALVDTSGAALTAVLGAAVPPSFIKPNADELAALVGQPVPDVAAAAEHARTVRQRTGIDQVAVSLGADGAVLAADDGCWQARGPALRPVNTVGCGDAFVGAFASAWAAGQSPAERLVQAVAVSGASAEHPGTGSFSAARARELADAVQLVRLP